MVSAERKPPEERQVEPTDVDGARGAAGEVPRKLARDLGLPESTVRWRLGASLAEFASEME